MMNRVDPVWFITGCSTGFGRGTGEAGAAKGMESRGHGAQSFAKSNGRHCEGVRRSRARPATRRDTARPDRCRDRSGHAAIRAHRRVGRVSAGYGYLAAIEEGRGHGCSSELFETNVFGLVDMTKAVLPIMRAQRGGLVVNVSSIGGLASFAATGYYHGTKYAVEGISRNRWPLKSSRWAYDVLIVEPGPFRTNWAGPSIQAVCHSNRRVCCDLRRTPKADRCAQWSLRRETPCGQLKQSSMPHFLTRRPLRLLLGKTALELARRKIDLLRRDFDAWEAATLGADYPEGTP